MLVAHQGIAEVSDKVALKQDPEARISLKRSRSRTVRCRTSHCPRSPRPRPWRRARTAEAGTRGTLAEEKPRNRGPVGFWVDRSACGSTHTFTEVQPQRRGACSRTAHV